MIHQTDISRDPKEWDGKDSPELTKDIKVLALVTFTILCLVGAFILCGLSQMGFFDLNF
ncbi:MAG TPA: hypothetical protein VFU05_02800 [Cyclobacteriaceae bacterium]|nr:hypothetical protein [Cyclobacteriaceae bacterium]